MPRKKKETPQEATNNIAHLVLNRLQEIVDKGKLPPEQPGLNEYEKQRVRKLALEVTRRSFEALRLYEPMLPQEAFHASKAKERIVYGSNRGGKTLATVLEVVRAVTGQDPYNKYPKTNGVCYVVGKDQKQIAEVLWRKMARPEPFRMIRDLQTKNWRTYRPYDPTDLARKAESKPAPPLLPKRWIKDIAWEDKKMDLPKIVTLTTGWKIHFFSGNAKPPQGSIVDLALFDEEIPDGSWYSEISARLVDRNGRFIWGATPQHGTDQLFELHVRAEKELLNPETRDNPSIAEFKLLLLENKYISAENKLEFISKLSEEERRVRVDGEFAIQGALIYPEYRESVHCVDWFDIPQEWTRYVGIDPGHQICAALFMAIPPPGDLKHGHFAYLYDELYIANCDAEMFARRMADKARTQTFQAFIFDMQHGRKVESTGDTIAQIYSEALKKHKVSSIETGHGFIAGSTDRVADVEAIRLWLRGREGLPPKLKIIKSACPMFDEELTRWRYKKDPKGYITNTPEDRGRVHACACLRYLVQHDPKYVSPTAGARRPSYAEELLRKRMANRPQQPLVMLGPVGG